MARDTTHLSVKLHNEQAVKKLLTDLGLDMRNLRGAMNEVGRSTIRYFSGQVFVSRGATIGQRWQRLSDRYATQKARTYPGRPILVRTGRMQSSFKYDSTAMSVTISNSAPHFKYHQSSDTRYVLPRRAIIGIYNGMQHDVTATIAQVISRKIRERAG